MTPTYYITKKNFGFRGPNSIVLVTDIKNGIVYFTWENEDKDALLYSGVNTISEDIFNDKFDKLSDDAMNTDY